MDEQLNALEETSIHTQQNHEVEIPDSRDELLAKIRVAFDEVLELAELDDISPVLLNKVLMALSKPKSPSSGTAALVVMYTSLNAITRRGSYIAVNPTGRARRRDGLSKGAKRVHMGRPSQAEQRVRGKSKKARNLSQCVNANVANAKDALNNGLVY